MTIFPGQAVEKREVQGRRVGWGKPPSKYTLHVNFMQFVMFYVPRLLMGANVTLGNLKMTDFNLYNLFY